MNQIFDSTDERYTVRHLTGQVRSVIVQRRFCPLHIRYIFVLSVIHPLLIRQSPLVDRPLSVTYALLMHFCAPYTFREDPYSHRNNLQHLKIFTFFLSVRRLLPLSGNLGQHHKWQYPYYERQLFRHRKNIAFALVAKIVKLL